MANFFNDYLQLSNTLQISLSDTQQKNQYASGQNEDENIPDQNAEQADWP